MLSLIRLALSFRLLLLSALAAFRARSSHIHAVDGYEEVSTAPVASATPADKDSNMTTNDSAAR